MKLYRKLLVVFITAFLGSVLCGLDAAPENSSFGVHISMQNDSDSITADSLHYQVRNYNIVTYNDLEKQSPVDLKDPSNVHSDIDYDVNSGLYVLHTKVGGMDVATPYVLDSSEYQTYSQQQFMNNYWKEKNKEAAQNFDEQFNLTDMKFSLGPADKVFGPGGVQVKTQGSVEMKFGVKTNHIDNPSLSQRLRTTTSFDFAPTIQMNVNASVGDKLKFNLNYNTESSFDYDQQALKLNYTGKEDDIIQSIQAGNISMPLNSTLITGASSLFGIKTDLKFGRLTITAVASQQKSQSQTVSSKNGKQLTEFEIDCGDYDADRHFFLSQYFRNHFDKSMADLPNIASGITINRIEVWVTNLNGNYSDARNIVAFEDLGEESRLGNAHWSISGATYPNNNANSLYSEVSGLSGIRDISQANEVLDNAYSSYGMAGGTDYEKIESARKLSPSEYTLNTKLGFISLNTALKNNQVLAVAFQYTLNGKTYQVGEFSTDGIESPNTLIVKLLRSSSPITGIPLWDLMMKNVYSVGGTGLQPDGFKLNVQHQSDSTGVYLNYITEGNCANQLLLRVMNLDRINSNNMAVPDGKFDFVDGYTVLSSSGRIIFPVVEPFGSHLRQKIGNDAIADKYCFQALYDSTKVVALEDSEHDKYRLYGKFQGSGNSSTISLNAMNVAPGSVIVTCGGETLTENVDYTVDYTMGTVTILNQSILASGNEINVSLENQSTYNIQRKTMLGTHLEYAFNDDFSVGGTLLHLSEMPLVTNTAIGSEPISNTIWGVNTAYKNQNQWLTKAVDALPLVNATAPSSIQFNGEFAQLIPGTRKTRNNPGYAYLDDFESAETDISLLYPTYWHLASTPYDDSADALFPEAALSNNVDNGKNRALFSWFSIDNSVFNAANSSSVPSYLRTDDMRSNNLTRKVNEQEIFPNKETTYGESSYLPVLNISYYPSERGPYNLDENIDPNTGNLLNPAKRWGGMTRAIDQSDFETANIQYVEFWLMDPFVNDSAGTAQGGDLYIDLGSISEDVLKDGKKFFENGLSATGDTTATTRTVWGRVPTVQSTVLAFDTDAGARKYQDVGYDGLSTADEETFLTYKNYVNDLRHKVSASVLSKWQSDAFSPLNDPAGDNYHHYRGTDYDKEKLGVLDRYKYFCGPDGNSPVSSGTYSTSSTTRPDAEDINDDNTLNEYERYYQYKVSLRRADLVVGSNYIVNKVESNVKLVNGKQTTVNWYEFKIPISDYQKKVGSISGFKSIQFMRMFLTDFKENTFLRFATLQLVRGDWRAYTKALYPDDDLPATTASMDVSSVNIEENSNKTPVNYVLPPGVTRETDPSQPSMVQENEQSLSLKVMNLAPEDARAVYKNTNYDLRNYGRLQMFTHAEKLIDDDTHLANDEVSVFIRLGSDHTQNYYEYEIPLKLTPAGHYSSSESESVWPDENMFNFPLSLLTDVKKARNAQINQRNSDVGLDKPYSEYDPDNLQNKVTVVGSPNLGDVQVITIGVRNHGRTSKSIEVWTDELRMTNYKEDGGWAATGNMAVNFSDVGSFNLSAKKETAGFGGLEQSLNERRMDDLFQLDLSTQIDLGRFFPEKAKLQIPLYYAFSKETVTPKYNPLDKDIFLNDALNLLRSQTEKDSLLDIAQTRSTTKSFNLTNVKMNIRSKKPKFYDPANFTFSYAYAWSSDLDAETERNFSKSYTGSLNYNYTASPLPWEPFKKIKWLNNPAFSIIRDFNLYYMPKLLMFSASFRRIYTETQLRDLTGGLDIDLHDPNNSLFSFAKEFIWKRQSQIQYDLSKSLHFSFNSNTNSYIDEGLYTPVDKQMFPEEYELWKDTVMHSIRNLGRPIAYQQVFTANWTIPLSKIDLFDWINANAQYSATYGWDYTASGNNIYGNRISNLSNITANGQFDFTRLYNKSKYLESVNNRYNARNLNYKSRIETKTYSQNISLTKGDVVEIKHHLGSNRLHVKITDNNGKPVNVKYYIENKNAIKLVSPHSDLKDLSVHIETRKSDVDNVANKALALSSRILMMVRSGSLTYMQTSSLTLPGYSPSVKFAGQEKVGSIYAPGAEFAFGMPNESFISKAMDNGWLVNNDTVNTPAVYALSKNLNIKMKLEPLPGLQIDLGSQYVSTAQKSIQYMYNDMPTTYSGTFRMSTISLATAFWSHGNSANNYKSKAFENMLANRAYFQSKLESRYSGTFYPRTGFMDGNSLAGKTFNPHNGTFSNTSAEVLIPSFLSAYTNTNVERMETSPFQPIMSMLPNWKLSYAGLTKIPWIGKNFKSFTLNHSYESTYQIGAYTSNSNYVENDNGLGFVEDVTTGEPIPSMPYDISTVSINEIFSPFIGINMVLRNSFTGKLQYNKSRTLTLNISNAQVLEALNDQLVFGVGYIIKNFNMILKLRNKEQKIQNDLTTSLDFTYRDVSAILRKIQAEDETQATSGNKSLGLKFSADYVFSSRINLKFYYEYSSNSPYILTSYPTYTSNVGLSVKLMMAR